MSTFGVTARKCLKCLNYRLNITDKFFTYHTVNVWNSLDNDVVMSHNCNTFKHVLQNIS